MYIALMESSPDQVFYKNPDSQLVVERACCLPAWQIEWHKMRLALWRLGHCIDDCLGLALHRHVNTLQEEMELLKELMKELKAMKLNCC